MHLSQMLCNAEAMTSRHVEVTNQNINTVWIFDQVMGLGAIPCRQDVKASSIQELDKKETDEVVVFRNQHANASMCHTGSLDHFTMKRIDACAPIDVLEIESGRLSSNQGCNMRDHVVRRRPWIPTR